MATTPGFAQFSSIIKAKSWSFVDAANPGVVQTQNAQIKIQSKILDTFVDTTNGKIAVINFEKAITFTNNKNGRLPIIDIGYLPSSSPPKVTMTLNGTASPTGPIGLYMYMQMVPILASFVTKNLTWTNTITSPIITTGAAVNFNFLTQTIINQSTAGTFASDIVSSTIVSTSSHLAFTAPLTINVAVYGFLVEIYPHYTLPTGLSVAAGTLAATVNTNDFSLAGSTLSCPFIVPAF